jgi:hypothetical protein
MKSKRRAGKVKDVEPFQPIDVIRPPHAEGGTAETELPSPEEPKEGMIHKAPHVEIPDCDPPRD